MALKVEMDKSQKKQANSRAAGIAEAHATPERLWIALAQGYREMSSLIEQSFEDSGMSLTDFMLLEALLHKGPMTITAIQSSALLATGSMTAAVDRLETRGWIKRTASKKDRRARVLILTDEGKRIITPVYREHSSNLRRWMSVLSTEERACTFIALPKLTRHLKVIPR